MNKSKLIQSNRGFTLVELLMVMVFATVLLLGMLYFYSNHVRRSTELNAKTEAQQQLDHLLDLVLFGAAVTDDCPFNRCRRVFHDRTSEFHGRQHGDAARAEAQGLGPHRARPSP